MKGFAILSATLLAIAARQSHAQAAPGNAVVGKDTVTVRAGADYAAGSFHRKMLGDNYRDLWTMPIKVPVLNLGSFVGGIKPLKESGGKQTKSLRFATKDSVEWVFRSVHKSAFGLPGWYEGTLVWYIYRDEGSASHPFAAAAAAPLMRAAGVIHPNPILVVMPDDPILGEFKKDFAGVLGWMEEYPNVPKDAPAFADASEIIDSEDLLAKLDKDPDTNVDERSFLNVRLLDMMVGDNDRHPLQWKWARMGKGKKEPWEPIPRDRDKVFVSYEGTLLNLARKGQPSLVEFLPVYPDPKALFRNAMEQDKRLLGSLDKRVWDSVAVSLQHKMSDAAIDGAVRSMPQEFAASSSQIAQTLHARRDQLPQVADVYYALLWSVADVHGTDAADRADVTRSADGSVEVTVQSGDKAPYFDRRFDPGETKEIRVYLHDGDDSASIAGSAPRSIPVRVIGGNGNNILVDASTVGGERNTTRFYDAGSVSGVKYARDSAQEKQDEDLAINNYFNRRPWVRAYGTLIPPGRDHGSSTYPIAGLKTGRGLGVVPRIGIAHYSYGFRKVPYASMWKAEVAYATTNRFEVALAGDKKFEESSIHLPVEAKATQLEVVQFHGFGNDIPDLRTRFYHVKQTQFSIRPAIGVSLNPESEISVGPIVRYTVTDSSANRFISQERPFGFSHFAQVGLQLRAHYDTRVIPDTLKPRAVFDFTGSGYPGIWDATTPYSAVAGAVTAFVTIPVPKRPVLALHGGGKKLYGDFPYFDAAFLGGSSSLRSEERQRFAGDASVFGSAELRVPVAQVAFILPLDIGLLGFIDAGRVYMDGESPGGWHNAAGAGFWAGLFNPGSSVNVLFTNNRDRRVLTSIGFAF